MTALAITLSALLILACVVGSIADFRHNESIVATMARFGLPHNFEVVAGVVKLAAGGGLAVGFADHSARGFLTTLVAACLVAYFAIASSFHVRAGDAPRDTAPAVALCAVSLALAFAAV